MHCPHCHQEATEIRAFLFRHGVAYCGSCGWNIERATEKLRIDMWAMWATSGTGLLLAAVVWIRGAGVSGALVIAVAFVALPLGSGILTRHRLSKIAFRRADAPERVVPPPSAVPATQAGEYQASDLSPALQPRVPRFTMRGYFYSAGLVLGTAFVLWLLSLSVQGIAGASSTGKTKSVFALLVWGLLLWSCVSFFRNRIRERRLFTNGELSQGIVLTQSNTRFGSRIVYGYRDVSGNSFQNRVTDFSNQLFEQMPIRVFYNPLNSRESAALESSLYSLD